jgi:hypothetical protein
MISAIYIAQPRESRRRVASLYERACVVSHRPRHLLAIRLEGKALRAYQGAV